MNGEDILSEMRTMYRGGLTPSGVLRWVVTNHGEVPTPELMRLMRDAFALEYEDVQCIGGWWHDGTGELSDERLDAFLERAIRRENGSSDIR